MKAFFVHWKNLSAREQRLILVGSIILFLMVFYFALLEPLYKANHELENEINNNQRILKLMQHSKLTIDDLNSSKNTLAKPLNKSLSATIEESLNRQDFASNSIEIKQIDKTTIQMKIPSVNYSKLVTWLADLGQKYAINTNKATLVKLNDPGEISANIQLSRP